MLTYSIITIFYTVAAIVFFIVAKELSIAGKLTAIGLGVLNTAMAVKFFTQIFNF